ncbi:MAG TPA: efflux RND transporter periplasmic adaptor subunit [Gemmatimonadales bacterium]|nr:efflux RND transporter periplasmic adaptor subunit [Gemmatimonadales bacterium]
MKRVLLIALSLGCGGERASTRTAPPVESGALKASNPAFVTADTATVMVPLTLSSQLYVEHDATVYARSAGIVEAVLVDLGSKVTAGQPLARLESADQRIALAQAEERFTNSKQTVERYRELKVAGVTTEEDAERVEFEHRQALLALRQAQRDLALTRIVAPFAGVVTARKTRLHHLVSAGDTLFRVTAMSPILAAVHVPEAAAGALRIGTEAQVRGLDGHTEQARVIRASPTIDPASGGREIVLQLSRDSRFTPGSSVTVSLGGERRQVVTVPRSAVGKDGYVQVWADERTTLRALTLGTELAGDRVEVVRGLAPGERLVGTAP